MFISKKKTIIKKNVGCGTLLIRLIAIIVILFLAVLRIFSQFAL